MNEQELNKKLEGWVWADENDRFIASCKGYDNFTQSLDACDEWLVPKLFESCFGITLYHHCKEDGEYYEPLWTACVGCDGQNISVYKKNKNPALALCLATEVVIDNE